MKTQIKLNHLVLTITFLLFVSGAAAFGQGTIQIQNSALTRIKYQANCDVAPVDAPVGSIVIGVFWGTSPDQLTMSPVTLGLIGAGIIGGGAVYALPGSTEGQSIFLQIKGWDATAPDFRSSAHQGQTDILQVTLGPTAGPGTVIWQSAAGTSPVRFKPFVVAPLCPEPGVMALAAVGGFAFLISKRRVFGKRA